MADNSAPITEIKKLGDELRSTWEQTKEIFDRQDAEIAKHGEATGETKEYVEKLGNRLDEIETKLTRPGAGAPTEQDSADAEYAKAFWAAARHGKSRVNPEQAKTLSSGSAASGGLFVPEQWAKELLKNVIEYSPVREFATVTQISAGDALSIARKTGETTAGWVAELGTRSERTNPTYGRDRVPVHEGYLRVDVSKQLLEDAAYDFESELQADFAEQRAVLEGAAHISGDTLGKPEGILENDDVSFTVSGHASTITADGLISIYHDLKSAYLKDAVWLMERAALKAIRSLKDNDNQYLWTPGFGTTLVGDMAPTILGRPYRTAEDMPTVGAGTFPVIFGSLKAGYRIVDRIDLEVMRDELTKAETGEVKFTGRFRSGGQVVLAEAIRKLKISA